MHFATQAVLLTSVLFYVFLCSEAQRCVILKKGTDNGEAVEAHNYYRRLLNKGRVAGQPRARYIPPLKWNSYLAKEAMKVAATCEFEHRHVSSCRLWSGHWQTNKADFGQATAHSLLRGGKFSIIRYIARWSFVGQNLYIWGTDGRYKSWVNWKGVVKPWFDENRIYSYGSFSRRGYKKIGHYTQVVWQKTTHVGCGYAIFRRGDGWTHKMMVCHYGPGGNILGQVPYRRA